MPKNNKVCPYRVADLLRPGAENATTRKELARIMDISDIKLRQEIRRERLEGLQILSSSSIKGYYLPNEDTAKAAAERAAFIKECRSRGRELFRVAKIIEEADKSE